MHLAFVYLALGGANVALSIARRRYSLKRSTVTCLRAGQPPVTKETRQVADLAIAVAFDLLFWFVPILFWLIFVPIHDALAKRAWQKNSSPWEPTA